MRFPLETGAYPNFLHGNSDRSLGVSFRNRDDNFFSSELRGEVVFACENYGFSQQEIHRRVDNAIRQMKLESLQVRSLDILSGGEKQRTAIASAYALHPIVYVLDEPTANLDACGTNQLKETLHQLKKEGCALLIAEHRLSWLEGIADRYVYMAEGYIRSIYSPAEIKNMSDVQREEMGIRATSPLPIRSLTPSDMQAVPAIRTEKLSCRRGRTVIWQELSLHASRGRMTAVTGRNGIGKTTLGLVLCGMIRCQGGCIYINGVKMTSRKLRQNVYYCSNDTVTQFFTDNVSEELLLNKKRTERNLSLAREMPNRMKLCRENAGEPKAMHMHTRGRIYPAIAAFRAMSDEGGRSQEGFGYFVQVL